MIFRRTGVLSLFVALFVSACAGTQAKPDSASLLKERAATYWRHKIKGELAEAYFLELPVMRKKVSLTDYIKAFSSGYLFLDAKVKSVAIDGASARVNMEVRYAFLGVYSTREGIRREIVDSWKRVDGQWYHEIKRVSRKSKNKGGTDMPLF